SYLSRQREQWLMTFWQQEQRPSKTPCRLHSRARHRQTDKRCPSTQLIFSDSANSDQPDCK
ncbi:hypothetical protein CH063_07221, partial [Colletotrichum higginsianum]